MQDPSDTERYESLLRLSPIQSLAADVLYMGGTHQEAANAAGVNRVPVTRWVHHHPAFIAEMTRRKFARYESLASCADEVSRQSIALVQDAVLNGDLATALTWLKLASNLGRFRDHAIPAEDAEISASAVIKKAAKNAALNDVFDMYSTTYSPGVINRIQAELND